MGEHGGCFRGGKKSPKVENNVVKMKKAQQFSYNFLKNCIGWKRLNKEPLPGWVEWKKKKHLQMIFETQRKNAGRSI